MNDHEEYARNSAAGNFELRFRVCVKHPLCLCAINAPHKKKSNESYYYRQISFYLLYYQILI